MRLFLAISAFVLPLTLSARGDDDDGGGGDQRQRACNVTCDKLLECELAAYPFRPLKSWIVSMTWENAIVMDLGKGTRGVA